MISRRQNTKSNPNDLCCCAFYSNKNLWLIISSRRSDEIVCTHFDSGKHFCFRHLRARYFVHLCVYVCLFFEGPNRKYVDCFRDESDFDIHGYTVVCILIWGTLYLPPVLKILSGAYCGWLHAIVDMKRHNITLLMDYLYNSNTKQMNFYAFLYTVCAMRARSPHK